MAKTYKELLLKHYPDFVCSSFQGGAFGCPADYFENAPHISNCDRECFHCWNYTLVPTEPKVKPVTASDRIKEEIKRENEEHLRSLK